MMYATLAQRMATGRLRSGNVAKGNQQRDYQQRLGQPPKHALVSQSTAPSEHACAKSEHTELSHLLTSLEATRSKNALWRKEHLLAEPVHSEVFGLLRPAARDGHVRGEAARRRSDAEAVA